MDNKLKDSMDPNNNPSNPSINTPNPPPSNIDIMQVSDYAEYIKTQLGAPIVQIEVEDQIPSIIINAFKELKGYITDTRTVTVPYNQCMNLSQYNIYSVTYVMRTNNPTRIADFTDVIYLSINKFPPETLSLTDYRRMMLINQTKNTLSTDLQFHWESPYLYCSTTYPMPDHVTVAYVPDYQDPSEITEPHWQSLLKRLSLAMTKEMLGRVRGKYQLSSALYNLDSNQLLQEAQTELTEIRTYLDNNSDVVLPID